MFTVTGFAASQYIFELSTDKLFIEGKEVNRELFKYNGSNYIPLRAAAETLGVDVAYIPGRIDLTSKKTDLEKAIQKNIGSCVMIRVYDSTDVNTAKYIGNGSGVILEGGIILTAKHVLDAGKMYGIQFNDTPSDREFRTTKRYTINSSLDIAFLESPVPTNNVVTLGDSSTLNIGEKIFTISSPGALKNNISEGMISGLTDYKDGNSIQITAKAGGGSSGGGIFSLNGDLIGIYVSNLAASNDYHFVVPINNIKPILEQIK